MLSCFKNYTFPYSVVTSQVLGEPSNLKTEDVIICYLVRAVTPQWVVIIECGAMMNKEKNLLHCHFVHHKSHTKSLGTKPEAPQ
jgi:hypothetical protein